MRSSEFSLDQAGAFKSLEVGKQDGANFLQYEQTDLLIIFHVSLIMIVLIHLLYFIYMLIQQNLYRKKSTKQPTKPENLRKINESCTICLDDITHEVQLLCSHSYCGKCLIEYGKQRWNFVDIQCPMCRSESKLIFSQFERNEENKEIYDMVLNYNHEVTSQYPTSFCFCLDMLRFSLFYLRELTNFRNNRFSGRRTGFIIALLLVFFFVLFQLTIKFTTYLEFFEDLITYIFLIVLCSEYFYRTFRSQTNTEYDRIIVSENTNRNLTQNNNFVVGANSFLANNVMYESSQTVDVNNF
jgi:hypothetical protein